MCAIFHRAPKKKITVPEGPVMMGGWGVFFEI